MSLWKCKICGGELEAAAGVTVGECAFCGTKQTLPKASDEVIQNLFNRANNLRLKSEFDKAEQIYEKILQQNETEAEAHWGIVLCKYGIEYVEDPKTFKRIPTCHRTSYEAVTADGEYLAALANADATRKPLYEAEAKAIDRIQKDILNIVRNEKPFDVFICYKQADENGKRTQDSVIANDIYHQLTQEGLKVFYAAITLEDKLGQEYEPYIFAALNSAKVMLVVGTQPQYFSAVWVKNEWSRFLKLMKTDRSKLLIPCYKDMDAYDLPEEFAHLQAQDMSKIGFINDVVRGIRKVISDAKPKAAVVNETVVADSNANAAPLLKRAFMFLEDRDWSSANEYCEKVLDIDPENPRAYLGKLMAQLKVSTQEALKDCPQPFDDNNNYQKVLRFGDDNLKADLNSYITHINTRNENARLESAYNNAKNDMATACLENEYIAVAQLFEHISQYRDAADLAAECYVKAEICRKDDLLSMGILHMSKANATIDDLERAMRKLQQISGWKDADDQIRLCQQKMQEVRDKENARRLQQEHEAELAKAHTQRIERRNKITAISIIVAIVGVILYGILSFTVFIPRSKYNDAVSLLEAGDRYGAAVTFSQAKKYKDASERSMELWDEMTVRHTIDGGYGHTVGLKADGTVVAKGSQNTNRCNVSNWTDIVAIAAGSWHTVGLKADGTLIAAGLNATQQSAISSLKNIVAIASGDDHLAVLSATGTVSIIETNSTSHQRTHSWENIVAIAAGDDGTVGLKIDGTVVATGFSYYKTSNVDNWSNIVAIAAGDDHVVGLIADGTVVSTGRDTFGECNVFGWKNIVAVAAGNSHTVGLKADGTVIATGYNEYNQCNVSDWTDIVAISAGDYCTIGLKADGTVVAVGNNEEGQCDVSGWQNIKLPN